MSLGYNFTLNIIMFLAVVSRVTGFMLGFPLFRGQSLPKKTKMFIILSISVAILPALPENWQAEAFNRAFNIYDIIFLVVNDLLLGLAVSLVTFLTLEVASMAGQMMSANIGFSASSQFDPSSESTNSSFTILFTQMALVLFLVFDIHLDFLRVMGLSFRQISPGAYVQNEGAFLLILDLGISIFATGFKMSLPLIALVMFLNIAMGLMSRFGQDFQVLMLSFPIRLGAGIMLTISCIPVFAYMFKQLNESIIENLGRLIGL